MARPPGLLYAVDETPPPVTLVIAALQQVAVRLVYERALPKPRHLWPLRRHRTRPGVRSAHRPASNRFAARPVPKGRWNVAG